MKVLHLISGTLKGGAARGGAWLHLGLRDAGVDSRMLVSRMDVDYPSTRSVLSKGGVGEAQYYAHVLSELWPRAFYWKHRRCIFSSGIFGFSQIERHPWFQEADVIHLHWINLGMLSLKQIARINKPIVWTLRDMWPMTGGCHYAMGCQRYHETCGRCPMLGSLTENDLSRWNHRRKQRLFGDKKIHWVALSHWLARCAQDSSILKGQDIQVIPNGIEPKIFYPVDKKEARRQLGWPLEDKVILTGAVRLNFLWKGIDLFFDAYRSYLATTPLAVFGDTHRLLPEYRALIQYDLGQINDEHLLRLVYSAADVFVVSSIEEAFGKTLIEAMACGTPVVCFDAAGPADIVDHRENGYRARSYDTKDLARGIEWVLSCDQPAALSARARQKVEEQFFISKIVNEYREVYARLLEREGHDR